VIDQIRHLQSAQPFETFSIELTNGRIIQIYDQHQVSTAKGTHQGDAVVGVLYETGTFEVLNASQIVAVSVGVHPQVKQQLAARRAEIEKSFEDEDDEL